MRNGSSPLPKNIVREVPRIQPRRWFIVPLVLLVLIVVSAVGGKAIASGYLSIPGTGTASSQGQSHSLERLYILSELPNPDGSGSSVAGRVTVLNMASQREIVSIKAGVDVDVVPSADGSRLYIAGVDEAANGPGVDHLFAVDTQTGSEIWRVSLKDRVKYIGGGPSTLAISSDGSQLYVYSYPWLELDKYQAGQVPDWIEILDANTGRLYRIRSPCRTVARPVCPPQP